MGEEDWGSILKAEPKGFPDGLAVSCDKKEAVRQPAGLGLSDGRVGLPMADSGGSHASCPPFQSFLISPTTQETF